jgi:Copper type II ascorbate-dependent monooxygenase, N-terminal domain
MKGADIFLFDSDTGKVVDSYVLDQEVKPLPDDCQSWTLVDSFIGEEFLIVELTRALDTKDTQDRAFLPDGEDFIPASRVIAAWGDSATPTYHGPNFAKGSVRFFGSTNTDSVVESFRSAMDLDSDGSFFVGASNYSVPVVETNYTNFCFTYDDFVSQGIIQDETEKKHIIGVEALIDPRGIKHVHHFLVFASMLPGNSSCNPALQTDLVYMWAPGVLPAQPPPQVGIPIGGEAGYLFFSMQVHYDNKALVADVVDSSGIKV